MYGIITTLLAGRGSQLTPIAAPIALIPIVNLATRRSGASRPTMSTTRLSRAPARTLDEPFAMFMQG